MALINTSVPNLIQGVSQQPDATRFDGQCEEQVNALSSVAEGLKKRPNTRHIAKLLDVAIDENSFVHFINRSNEEKYVLIHDGTYLYAFNTITGVEAELSVGDYCYKKSWTASEVATHNGNDSDGNPLNSTTYVATGYPVSGSYLHSTHAKKDLKALTVGDSTYMVNTTNAIALGQEMTPNSENEALVFIKQGDYQKRYNLQIKGVGAAGSTVGQSVDLNAAGYKFSSGGENRWRITGVSVDPSSAGSGFSVGDILPLILSTTKYDTYTTDNDYDDVGTFTYLEYVAPTVRVTAVTGANNAIASLAVENAGNFTWKCYETIGYFAGTTWFGQNYNPNQGLGASVLTPSNSDGTTNSFNISASIESGTSSGTNAARNADTARIAGRLGNFAGTGVMSAANLADWRANFITYDNNAKNFIDGNLIVIEAKANVSELTITGTDGLGGGGIGVVSREVASISDLPLYAKDGHKVKVIGDAELQQDDYYVIFKTASGNSIGQGSWVEDVAPNLRLGYNPLTVPMELVNTEPNKFQLRHMKIADRTVGDDVTNPLASFTAQPIDNVFFFKNRLGFLSNENVIMSESGLGTVDSTGQLVYNFNRTTVTTLLDSDPIDVSVASSRVTNLKAAKGFQENLILFSETGQFVLKGGDVLTPKTISVTPVTNFSFEDQVDPLPLGSYIYFPFTRGAFTGLREFTVNASTDNYDSSEVTEHVPSYIPNNIIDIAGTTSEDMIVMLSGNEKGSLYIYNYFWNNEQKVLSAWSKFTFTGEIRGIEFIESTLYAVITNNGQTNLVEMPLESGLSDASGYVTHLDSRIANTVTNGSSTITLPYTPEDNSVQVYTTDGLALNCTNSGATVTLSSPVSADTDVWVGIPYTMKYTFSEQLFKAKAGNGKSPSNAAKMMVRNGSLYYDKSAYFKVKVTPKFRDTYTNIFTPDVVGSSTLGSLSLDSGFYRFPVFTKPQDTTITIENESALPSTFQSAEFESFVHSRSNRYG